MVSITTTSEKSRLETAKEFSYLVTEGETIKITNDFGKESFVKTNGEIIVKPSKEKQP